MLCLQRGSSRYKPTDLKSLAATSIEQPILDESVEHVIDAFYKFYEFHDWPLDRITKSREFRESLLNALAKASEPASDGSFESPSS
jgi:hypothetical protein